MDTVKIEDRDYDLWLLITRTHYNVKKARTHELRKYDLSPEQAGVLFYIHNSGNNAMPLEISRWMLREPQTITSIIDRMVKKGLIQKARDTRRRNVVRLSLSEKGEKAYNDSIKRESFHRIMGVLNEEKRELLGEILKDLLTAAKKDVKITQEEKEEELNENT
jgi:MarR family transcriptional regulator, organic hydroperoxide resistance regulator